MTVSLTNAGKRFNREWIFRNFNYTFLLGETYAIVGSNGSGKSTLLQVLAGSMDISEGKIIWEANGRAIDNENTYSYLTIAAPYLEVIEEMNAVEFFEFHFRFKPLLPNISIKEIIAIVGLEKSAKKQIRYYSSGMKQRIKLAQAVFSDVPLLLLDEPCTNLDESGYSLYNQLINDYAKGKTVIVSSNDENEYSFCENVISISNYK
jgi:ABC-type multidrug transport system ATPase subunit